MHLKITCTVDAHYRQLPYNHQYELSSWIYGRLADSDPAFSRMLHEHGFQLRGDDAARRFKFFTFSNISATRFKAQKRALYIEADEVSFDLFFLVPRAASHFLEGAFRLGECNIGNRVDGKLATRIKEVAVVDLPDFSDGTAKFQLISPAIVDMPVERADGSLAKRHLSPGDPEYGKYLFRNLLGKQRIAVAHGLLAEEPVVPGALALTLDPTRPPKRKPRTLKVGQGRAEQRLISYEYRFRVDAPPSLLHLGYLAGWGGRNAQGFGASKVIR